VLVTLHAENYWNDEHNQRDFFVQFAKRNGFDPLVAQNWYKIKPRNVARQVIFLRTEKEKREGNFC
jgi:hypothetical protein